MISMNIHDKKNPHAVPIPIHPVLRKHQLNLANMESVIFIMSCSQGGPSSSFTAFSACTNTAVLIFPGDDFTNIYDAS